MIILYVLEESPYCNKALKELTKYKIKYKSIIVENTQEAKTHYKKQSGMLTFPQIFIEKNDGSYLKIGGYDDLSLLISNSKDMYPSLKLVVIFFKILICSSHALF